VSCCPLPLESRGFRVSIAGHRKRAAGGILINSNSIAKEVRGISGRGPETAMACSARVASCASSPVRVSPLRAFSACLSADADQKGRASLLDIYPLK
jgi:hypothetical protein